MGAVGRILVVDDEPGIREVCERTLRAMGFEVKSAPDGQAALKKLDEQDFDFVLTDLSMPAPVDGTRLTEMIKSRSPFIDVVIMTAYPTLETAIQLLKNGAYDYLSKPFSQDLLESVVARCFEKRRLSDELDREKSQRRELAAAYAELQKVEHLKEAILSRLSHELRTPVCTSLLALETMQALNPEPEKLKHLDIMRSSLSRLQKTVEDVLFLARSSQDGLPLRRSPTDLKVMIEKVAQHYGSLWRSKQIRLETRLEELSEPVPVDPGHMETALKQLLLNAIHFNRKKGSILIQGRRHDSGIGISFIDTGVGIPKENIPDIFDGFYQAAEYLTREVGGLGLGLAIVRRIAEAHGGAVRVESEEGRGSTFTLSLPERAAVE
jgi:signal transduction histidine kinase